MNSDNGKDIIEYMLNSNRDTRNALIIKAFVKGMTTNELNKLLEQHGFCSLYSKLYSDIIWKFIFQNRLNDSDAKEIICKYLTTQDTNKE